MSNRGAPALTRDLVGVAAAFAVSGVVHLVRPSVFEPLIPKWLPGPKAVVVASGVAELACAAGIAVPQTRRAAAWATAAVLVGVWPGNVQMSVNFGRRAQRRPSVGTRVAFGVSLLRLPLQIPMIRIAVRAARR